MNFTQTILSIKTSPKNILDITSNINQELHKQTIQQGLCNVFVQHTSCSLIISENSDPQVLSDLEKFMSHLVSEDAHYAHCAEGKDDMPAHIRSVLTQTQLSIPVQNSTLALGTWQAVYLWEHRAQGYGRKILLSFLQ